MFDQQQHPEKIWNSLTKEFLMKDGLREAFAHELPLINTALQTEMNSLPLLVRPIAEHIMQAGGKRLRPMLTILWARALGFSENSLHTLSTALEFLHSATLVHDDILDNAILRRGRPAAHTVFGLAPAILAGDALLALANEIVSRSQNPCLTSCVATAIIQTAHGEIMEIAAARNPRITHDEYLAIITGKTAFLIQAACELGVLAAHGDRKQQELARNFGLNLGIAFQLVDDALDYTASANTSGKPLGGDLREGKYTLPLLDYIASLPVPEQERVHQELSDPHLDSARQDSLIQAISTGGFAEKTRHTAACYLEKARQSLCCLPCSKEQELLRAMTSFVQHRIS